MTRKKSGLTTTPSARSIEAEFEHELEVFRTEANAAAQFFYAYLAIYSAMETDKAVTRWVNTAPLFWSTNLRALQTSTFVALGRIFDTSSAHNVNRLLYLAQHNSQIIFSKEALDRRKQGNEKEPPEWLPEYLQNAYVPGKLDFQTFRANVNRNRKIYEDKYQALRHQVFAHRELSDQTTISALFAKTNVGELQHLLLSLNSLHEALSELYMNGRKPVLRAHRHSIKQMKDDPSPCGQTESVPERIVREVHTFLQGAVQPAPF